jgi:hypothetical protein
MVLVLHRYLYVHRYSPAHVPKYTNRYLSHSLIGQEVAEHQFLELEVGGSTHRRKGSLDIGHQTQNGVLGIVFWPEGRNVHLTAGPPITIPFGIAQMDFPRDF